MKQFFAPYFCWEDFKNGMYNIPTFEQEKEEVENAIKMLCDVNLFDETCKSIIDKWIISAKINLTNINCNRRAWLGQAACSFKFKSSEISTRSAWGLITEQQRIEANFIADKWIKIFEQNYERENRKIHYPMGEKLLF